MSSVQIRDVRKSFDSFEVLHGASIPIDDGEFVVPVGPSGCGKQTGAPLEFYDKPHNQFVAGFIGSPAMNFLKGKLKVNGSASLEGPNGVKLPLKTAPANSDGKPVIYGVRPETTGKRMNAWK